MVEDFTHGALRRDKPSAHVGRRDRPMVTGAGASPRSGVTGWQPATWWALAWTGTSPGG
jgi:hypothetical protein